MGRREGKKQHSKAMQPSGSVVVSLDSLWAFERVCWRRKHRESQAPAPASPSSLGRRTANPAFHRRNDVESMSYWLVRRRQIVGFEPSFWLSPHHTTAWRWDDRNCLSPFQRTSQPARRGGMHAHARYSANVRMWAAMSNVIVWLASAVAPGHACGFHDPSWRLAKDEVVLSIWDTTPHRAWSLTEQTHAVWLELFTRANTKLKAPVPGGCKHCCHCLAGAEPQGCGLLGIPGRARPCCLRRAACGAVRQWPRPRC
jgi:hypothetical protein